MINFKNEMNMYDMFIDKDVVTTQELLSVGFTNKDLTRLIEDGKIKRVKRGYYELTCVNGLFRYSQILFSNRYKMYDRGFAGLKRCLEIDPKNGSVHTRMFLNLVITADFEQAFESFKVMDETENECYKKDQNMWLYLLSFVMELPEEYQERARNMNLKDILTLPDDNRYSDRLLQNRIRNAIFRHNFKEALELSKGLVADKDKKINVVITEKLLSKVISQNVLKHDQLYNLIVNGSYEEARNLLLSEKELHGINPADEQFLIVIEDLIGILRDNKMPAVDYSREIKSFNDAVIAHNYEKLLEIYRYSANRKFSKSSKFMGILLERISAELNKNELVPKKVEPVINQENVAQETSDDNATLFTNIAASLIGQDVNTAFNLLDEYLISIGKSEFRGYVADLIKLSILQKDLSFSEPILLLSVLSRDEFDFSVAAYIQDFYFNVARKKFKEAAIYLDILSMSEQLGGVKIPTYDLYEKLIEDAEREGISKEELGIKEKIVEPVEVVEPASLDDNVSGIEREETSDKLDTIESLMEVPYSLTDALDDILDDVNMIMLEPMNDEEISSVVAAAVKVPKVQAITIREASGEKRVVLRYYDKFGPYVNIGETLKLADQKYKNWEYLEAIDLYQSVMPKLEKPRSFIFARLGNCYRQTTYDGDFSKAIDYYTMAMAQSSEEDEPLDFTSLIADLKSKSLYNGVKVERPLQYKKENS